MLSTRSAGGVPRSWPMWRHPLLCRAQAAWPSSQDPLLIPTPGRLGLRPSLWVARCAALFSRGHWPTALQVHDALCRVLQAPLGCTRHSSSLQLPLMVSHPSAAHPGAMSPPGCSWFSGHLLRPVAASSATDLLCLVWVPFLPSSASDPPPPPYLVAISLLWGRLCPWVYVRWTWFCVETQGVEWVRDSGPVPAGFG